MDTVTPIKNNTKFPPHAVVELLASYQLQSGQEETDEREMLEHRQYLVSHIDDFSDCV